MSSSSNHQLDTESEGKYDPNKKENMFYYISKGATDDACRESL